jgi:hypothetical protein
MKEKRYFDEDAGWITKEEVWQLPATVKKYRLVNPELGKASEIEEYTATELQTVFTESIEYTEEKYIEIEEI